MSVRLTIAVTTVCLTASAAPATPVACTSPCTIEAATHGYSAPLTEVAAGSSVRWVSADIGHPTGEAFPSGAPCFVVPVGPDLPVKPVLFSIVDGSLRATTSPGTPDALTRTCVSALASPQGSMVLPYRCIVHPWMVATLAVTVP